MNDNTELSVGAGIVGVPKNEGASIDAQQDALRDTLFSFVDKMYPITGLPVVEKILVQNQLDVQIDKRKTYKATLMKLIRCCYPKDSDEYEFYGRGSIKKSIKMQDIVTEENKPIFKAAETILTKIAKSGKSPDELIEDAWFDGQEYFTLESLTDTKTCYDTFAHVVGHAFSTIGRVQLEFDNKSI